MPKISRVRAPALPHEGASLTITPQPWSKECSHERGNLERSAVRRLPQDLGALSENLAGIVAKPKLDDDHSTRSRMR
jgi:hypothetical protein